MRKSEQNELKYPLKSETKKEPKTWLSPSVPSNPDQTSSFHVVEKMLIPTQLIPITHKA